MTSKKYSRVLRIFKLEIKGEAEAKALISQNLTRHTTDAIWKVEGFRSPVSVQQCWNCQNFGHWAKTRKSKIKCLIYGDSHHHKGSPNREKSNHDAPTVKGHRLLPTKSIQRTKKQAFRQHVMDNKKSYAAILCQNTALPQPQDKTFIFSAKQLVKFVAKAAIQATQSQVCYINSSHGATDKKSSMCRRVSEAAKTYLHVFITRSSLFDAIGHLRPLAPCPQTKTLPYQK